MKTLKVLSIILIGAFTMGSSLSAQGFQPPEEGKAVIYFVHIKKVGKIEYFHQDKYIGRVFDKKTYIRYECDPGENLFWASAENKEFVTANLLDGGTYIVLGQSIMGAWSARVRLTPITESSELFIKAQTLINDKPPVVVPESEIEQMNIKLNDREFIKNVFEHYENEWKGSIDFPHISADMAIPPEKLK
jgi:hypothetical protein